jgi:predicted RNA-binding Zn ribbon-like protein
MAWPPRFLFLGGRLSVDFAQAGGAGRYARFERLHAPADLRDWLLASPLRLRVARAGPADLAAAKRLRGALWRAAQAVARGAPPGAGAVRTIQRFAARPDLVPVLRGGRRAWRRGSTATEALSTIARDAIALLGTDARHRLRTCRNPLCPLLFVDASRPGRRAWCTMRRCGNLQKTARYRRRRRRSA